MADSDNVYRGLSSKDLDMLIIGIVDDFDLWGWFNDDNSKLDQHINRVITAREEIRLENPNG